MREREKDGSWENENVSPAFIPHDRANFRIGNYGTRYYLAYAWLGICFSLLEIFPDNALDLCQWSPSRDIHATMSCINSQPPENTLNLFEKLLSHLQLNRPHSPASVLFSIRCSKHKNSVYPWQPWMQELLKGSETSVVLSSRWDQDLSG